MPDRMPWLTWWKRVLLKPFGQRGYAEYPGYWCDHLHWNEEEKRYWFNHLCPAEPGIFNACPTCEANRPSQGEQRWGSPR